MLMYYSSQMRYSGLSSIILSPFDLSMSQTNLFFYADDTRYIIYFLHLYR